jgi:hypothetical protein
MGTHKYQSQETCRVSGFHLQLHSTPNTDTTGFLAVDTTNNLIVLSFRGSESIENYLNDLNFPSEAIDLCTGCEGDSGFWSSWVSARDLVSAAVNTTAAANPSFKIIATGHSLGAAVATFAAAEFRKQGLSVDLVSLYSAYGAFSRHSVLISK